MSGPLRRSRLRRALGLFAPVVLAATLASIAGAASGPPSALSGLGAWATAGSRLAFVATVGGRQGLWVERFGSGRPTRIGPAACAKEEQIDQLAAGPNGSWGCLERTVGNTEAYYSVDVISSSGVSRQVASAGGPTGEGEPPVDSIPQLFGDGNFLGYLHVTADGVVQLMRITASARPRHIATLVGVSIPTAVAIAGRTIAVLQQAGNVSVFTTTGEPLATIPTRAASLALTANRVVVRTTNRRLVVYGPGRARAFLAARRGDLDSRSGSLRRIRRLPRREQGGEKNRGGHNLKKSLERGQGSNRRPPGSDNAAASFRGAHTAYSGGLPCSQFC